MEDHLIVLDRDAAGGIVLQFLEEFRLEPTLGEPEMLELLGVDEPACPIVA